MQITTTEEALLISYKKYFFSQFNKSKLLYQNQKSNYYSKFNKISYLKNKVRCKIKKFLILQRTLLKSQKRRNTSPFL